MTDAYSERLFSYGTLQQEAVQIATFGRKLRGSLDSVLGHRLSEVKITDLYVLATSGLAVHRIMIPSDDPAHEVHGTVFAITPEELAAADGYETKDYKRISIRLRSGMDAWVYVSAQAV
ncbi:MAG TPA: gamma-glutamylcyclotransferase family protein [Gammaproteobacteria bacterium]|jgi:gamma-glutamylcyclotransferase (GGCT)/AIG2-like uncharacterized protein YtfP|nr:gamma-glutamylcyclotransferase family protein [Gammaproteobacteria bacterium]